MTAHRPIRRAAERLIHRNPWVTLYFDEVDTPWGRRRHNRIVEGAPAAGPGVVVVPRDNRGRVLFIRSYRYAAEDWLWELPRGYGEPGQSGVESGRRELAEETGLDAERFVELGSVMPNPSILTTRAVVLLADDVHGDETLDVRESVSASRWLTRVEIADWIGRGEIRDALSLAALMLLRVKDDAAVPRLGGEQRRGRFT